MENMFMETTRQNNRPEVITHQKKNGGKPPSHDSGRQFPGTPYLFLVLSRSHRDQSDIEDFHPIADFDLFTEQSPLQVNADVPDCFLAFIHFSEERTVLSA